MGGKREGWRDRGRECHIALLAAWFRPDQFDLGYHSSFVIKLRHESLH